MQIYLRDSDPECCRGIGCNGYNVTVIITKRSLQRYKRDSAPAKHLCSLMPSHPKSLCKAKCKQDNGNAGTRQ